MARDRQLPCRAISVLKKARVWSSNDHSSCLVYPCARMTCSACHFGRVQFDRREMGVERVRDVDVMPINPTENLPASFIEAHSHILMNGHAMVEGQAVQHHRGTARDGPPARGPAAGRAQQEARAAAAAAQESDMHTLSEVPFFWWES